MEIVEIFSSPYSVTISLVVLAVTIYSLYVWRQITWLRRKGFPGPTPLPIVGNAPEQFIKGFDVVEKGWIEKYGKVFGFYMGASPFVMVADPELLKTIFIKDFPHFMNRQPAFSAPNLLREGLFFLRDRRWKQTRNILTPAFSAGKLKEFIPILNKAAETLTSHILQRANEVVEIKTFFGHFTMDCIASTAFGIDVDSQNQPNDPFVANVSLVLNVAAWKRFLNIAIDGIPGVKSIMKTLGFGSFSRKAIDFYDKTTDMLIEQRRSEKTGKIDFIRMLLEADLDSDKSEYIKNGTSFADTHVANGNGHLNGNVNGKANGHVQKLPDNEIKATSFLFFVAGYETTASLLRFSAHILSLNPHIDQRLYEEIEENIGKATPTYESIASLTYMDKFIDEVLRMFPPVTRLTREVKEDVMLGGKLIPKGCSVVIPVYYIHHNPEYYPDPEVFDPERFSPDSKAAKKTDGITYMPFGIGPRHCIGMRLALVEAKLALAHVLRKVRFVRCDKTQETLSLSQLGLMKPKTEVFVRVEKRQTTQC